MIQVIDNRIFVTAKGIEDIELLMHLCHLEDYKYIVIDVCDLGFIHISIIGCIREMMNHNKNVLLIYNQDVLDDKVEGLKVYKNK